MIIQELFGRASVQFFEDRDKGLGIWKSIIHGAFREA